jgi:5-formyltetrahydrofolate cyclo-ligase
MAPEKRKADAARIALTLVSLPQFRDAVSIFCFLSRPDEVNTFPLVEKALAGGKRVFVPYCRKATEDIGVSEIADPGRDLIKGVYGIPEPREELRKAGTAPTGIDLFIIPGISFDHKLNRLGRGKGYFDRFLKDIKGKKPIIGLCFSEQIHPYTIPVHPHDIRPDLVITPEETIRESQDG